MIFAKLSARHRHSPAYKISEARDTRARHGPVGHCREPARGLDGPGHEKADVLSHTKRCSHTLCYNQNNTQPRPGSRLCFLLKHERHTQQKCWLWKRSSKSCYRCIAHPLGPFCCRETLLGKSSEGGCYLACYTACVSVVRFSLMLIVLHYTSTWYVLLWFMQSIQFPWGTCLRPRRYTYPRATHLCYPNRRSGGLRPAGEPTSPSGTANAAAGVAEKTL